MVSSRRAPVRPRVISSEIDDTVLLEDGVESFLEHHSTGILELVGGPRAGKTTALAHLASLPCAGTLTLVDDLKSSSALNKAAHQLVVYTTQHPLSLSDVSYELAPWCDEDLIEYLLAQHPKSCASVLERFVADVDRFLLDGKPELYCIVAEQFAASESVRDIRTALRQAISQMAEDDCTLQAIRSYAAAMHLRQFELAQAQFHELILDGIDPDSLNPLSYNPVQVLLTSDLLISAWRTNSKNPFPGCTLPRPVLVETAEQARNEPAVLVHLDGLLDQCDEDVASMAASVLHAADPQWRPDRNRCRSLPRADLRGADWDGIDLSHINLEWANLNDSILQNANFANSQLNHANLGGSRLERACMAKVQARDSNFSGANLTHALMERGVFNQARFTEAILEHVSAPFADFREADFQDASLRGAIFTSCDFREATLDGADLQNADLKGADLCKLALRTANLRNADFSGSNLSGCDLEFVVLPQARLKDANLSHACLTGSIMTTADFRNARLWNAGLADIEWEGADLRGADLRGCTFHLGSSRSGLVGSPYPCHGSRTEFYTDDYDDQTYKAPEEIRKANLCGADLRGANLLDVDFYLVDLRGAKYDIEQAAHFRRCDAILVDRAT